MSAAWIEPTTSNPADIVDRDSEGGDLYAYLEDYLDAATKQTRILVTGERGIGKSILTRWVIEKIGAERSDAVVPVIVDGRGIGYRQFLKDLAIEVVEGVGAALADDDPLRQSLDQLALLAGNDQITKSQVETLGRRYGAQGSIQGGGIFAKLKARFSWDETSRRGTTLQTVQEVTDELLRAALNGVLEEIAEFESAVQVVVFFDDLDQALTTGSAAEVQEQLKRILDVNPCIGVAHLRSEALFADVRREIEETVELRSMPPHGLMEMLTSRLERAPSETRDVVGANPEPFQQLASITGNPLVFLHWAKALLRVHPFPPPRSWRDDGSLLRIVRKAVPTGIDDELLQRFARVMDRCALQVGERWCRREDLLRGKLETDPEDHPEALSEEAVEHLERLGLLVPRDRFNPEAGYRMDPLLDLLRPSVAERLREA